MNLYRHRRTELQFISGLIMAVLLFFRLPDTHAAVSQTPPMGWNSFDMYNGLVNEQQVKDVADYMAENLLEYGWEYVCVDYLWYSTSTDFWNYKQDANFNPALVYDENGRVQPDPKKFPSSVGGKGLKPLADYVHARGLKFGLHLMRGVPRQAVARENPTVLGTTYKVSDIHTKTDPCGWLNVMWPLNMSHPGAQIYLHSLFEQYAQWGVDYVKVDDMVQPWAVYAHPEEIMGYRKAIDSCGREMVFSTSPGPTPLPNANFDIGKYANQWRIVNDFWDKWESLDEEFDRAEEWYKYAGPGHWPDGDMIPIGTLYSGKSKFTRDEQYTLMTLFAIMRSPLIWGGKLVDSNADELKLMQNSEVLAVNQNSTGNKPIVTGKTPVWMAEVPDSPIRYVAVFNRNEASADVTINFSDLGVTAPDDTLRDLWEKKDVGVFSNSYKVTLAPHQSKLYRLTPPGATMVRQAAAARGNVALKNRFTVRNAGGMLSVGSKESKTGFAVSVFRADGRLVANLSGCIGSASVPVDGAGVYLVVVKSEKKTEKHLVSRY